MIECENARMNEYFTLLNLKKYENEEPNKNLQIPDPDSYFIGYANFLWSKEDSCQ